MQCGTTCPSERINGHGLVLETSLRLVANSYYQHASPVWPTYQTQHQSTLTLHGASAIFRGSRVRYCTRRGAAYLHTSLKQMAGPPLAGTQWKTQSSMQLSTDPVRYRSSSKDGPLCQECRLEPGSWCSRALTCLGDPPHSHPLAACTSAHV
jgi:hypothetical protein